MSHGIDLEDLGLQSPTVDKPAGGSPLLAPLRSALDHLNAWIMVPCMAAVVVAAAILSYSVAARYFLKIPTEWQDETAVFLLIGATFFSGAFVQSRRGHVGVEAIAEWLPAWLNWWRQLAVELVSAAFCSFFAWKSWSLFLEAFHEGHTSNSTWGPPLWIPYLLMASGMSLLALQLALESVVRLADKETSK